MELYQLRTFTKVADEGNLTRASDALCTSQPAVSAQIKALEDELGVQLFTRTPKGMVLTPSGKQLYQQARATLANAQMMLQTAQTLRNELVGELKLSIHTDFEFMRVGELFRELSTTHPKLTSHFLQGSSAKLVDQLRRGDADAGFMFGPCKAADIYLQTVIEVPMRLVIPSSWAQKRTCSLRELRNLPWVYTSRDCPFFHLTESIFERAGLERPDNLVWVDSEDAVRTLLRSQLGISALRLDDANRAEQEGFGVVWQGDLPQLALSIGVSKRRIEEPIIKAAFAAVDAVWQDGLRAGFEVRQAG